jgi:hypothetical protein
VKYGNSPPFIKAPTRPQQEELARFDQAIAQAEQLWQQAQPQLQAAQLTWEKAWTGSKKIDWLPGESLKAHLPQEGKEGVFDGKRVVEGGDVGDFGFYDRFTVAARVRPVGTRGGTIVARTADTARAEGWSLTLGEGNKLRVHLVKRWLDDAIHVEAEEAIPADRWTHVAFRYDGSRVAAGIQIIVDGRPVRVKVLLDELNQSFQTKQPLRIGGGGGPDNRFRGEIRDVRIHGACLDDATLRLLSVTERVDAILAVGQDQRSARQRALVAAYFREIQAPPALRKLLTDLRRLQAERAAYWESLPTVMVMEEMTTPRQSNLLIRGQYDKPGEKVSPGTPTVLGSLPASPRNDRLALARWLVDGRHPLTARVAVNRLWQQHFSNGIVKTVDDFGSQGDWPSHPELLDWLATEFVRTGWDIKAMHRLIVTSAAYRQSSRTTRTLLARDPENRLLARGPRLRLSAEVIRDQALAASGLLVEHVGGPSVRPYQPAGLWKDLTGGDEYVQDHGPDLYRRGLYTFWKRTSAPPMMLIFDAPGREVCTVRESRTNTPLQALNLLNDVTFVEAARVLAQRVLESGQGSDKERVAQVFRHVLSRAPRPEESALLTRSLQRHRARFAQDLTAADQLLSAGEYSRSAKLDRVEWAALTMLASLVLNLDEAVTRE